jgi:hypothetical protein
MVIASRKNEVEGRSVLKKINPPTPRHKCLGLLRVDPERHFTHHPEGRSLAPSNGSKLRGKWMRDGK